MYSVTSRQSFEMVRTIRDKILNHLVSSALTPSLPGLSTILQQTLSCQNSHFTNAVKQGADEVPLVIVGNKSDLKVEQRQVSLEEGRQLAEEVNCAFTEASAFLDFNVTKSFELMIGEIEKSQNPGQPAGNNKCTVM